MAALSDEYREHWRETIARERHRISQALHAERYPVNLSPVACMIAAGNTPDSWQIELCESEADETLALTTRQAGKTTCISLIAMATAAQGMETMTEDAAVVVASPSFRQSARVLARARVQWRRVVKYHQGDPRVPVIVNRDPARIILSNGRHVIALPDNPDTIRGETSGLTIIEEAAYCSRRVYDAIEPMGAATNARTIHVSSAGVAGSVMHQAWLDVEAPNVLRLEVPHTRVPRISAEYIERQRRRLTAARFAQEYLCAWGAPQGGVFRDEDILAARGEWTSDWFSAA